jgi:D-alanyl-D-alanine carboxypeptidase (penicillin-binding protein 5/6)
VAAFVEAMNTEAQRLGTLHTRYTNPTGLHDPAMCTTARDIAIIAREAYANELYMTVSSTRTYTIPPTNVSGERLFSNRNALISDSSQNYYNGYCKGMNAGMTDEGGWCVVTVCERGGASNLCIILRGLDVGSGELIPAYVQTNRLLSWANRSYGYRTVLSAGETLDTLRVGMTGISKSKADVVTAENLKIYLPAELDAADQLTFDLILDGDGLTAPIKAGDIVGTVTVSLGGRIVGKAPLTVTEDFRRSGFLEALRLFRAYLTGRAFWLTVPIFAALLLPYLYATGSSRGRYGLRTVRRRRRIRYIKRHF